MTLDTNRLGRVAAEMMDSLAEGYAEHDVEVGEVLMIVEIKSGSWTTVSYRSSDPRLWVQLGLLAAAERAVHSSAKQVDEGGH